MNAAQIIYLWEKVKDSGFAKLHKCSFGDSLPCSNTVFLLAMFLVNVFIPLPTSFMQDGLKPLLFLLLFLWLYRFYGYEIHLVKTVFQCCRFWWTRSSKTLVSKAIASWSVFFSNWQGSKKQTHSRLQVEKKNLKFWKSKYLWPCLFSLSFKSILFILDLVGAVQPVCLVVSYYRIITNISQIYP